MEVMKAFDRGRASQLLSLRNLEPASSARMPGGRTLGLLDIHQLESTLKVHM